MKNFEEVLNFFNEFTSNDQYSLDRVIELNHVRDFITNVLSNCDRIDENLQSRVLDVINDKLLMVIDRNLDNLFNNQKFESCFLHLLCLEKLYKEEADKENKEVNTINGKEILGPN